MQRKGQAAMEFLMTYGWAILAAIIAIGVLAYFGVFSPGKFVPTATVLNPPLYANSWNIVETGNLVSIEVKNNGGEAIDIQGIEFTNSNSGGTTGACDDSTDYSAAPLNVGPGVPQILTVTCTGAGGLSAGDTFKADIAIEYTKSGG